jgi:SAM-dependent methyltransferase
VEPPGKPFREGSAQHLPSTGNPRRTHPLHPTSTDVYWHELGNLLELGGLRRRVEIGEQDLVFSLGLIDYFRDDFVVDLLDYAYDILRPGGHVVVGNFHAGNRYRGLLDYGLEWVLIHRTEQDMERLFAQSRFGRCADILFEEQRVSMFAGAIKAPS